MLSACQLGDPLPDVPPTVPIITDRLHLFIIFITAYRVWQRELQSC